MNLGNLFWKLSLIFVTITVMAYALLYIYVGIPFLGIAIIIATLVYEPCPIILGIFFYWLFCLILFLGTKYFMYRKINFF